MKKLLLAPFLFVSVCFASAQNKYGRFVFPALENTIQKDKADAYRIRSVDSVEWFRILLYPNAGTRGSAQVNFENDWQQLVACCYEAAENDSLALRMQESINESVSKSVKGNWEYKLKTQRFFQTSGMNSFVWITLITFSGFGEYSSMTIFTNNAERHIYNIRLFLNQLSLSSPPSLNLEEKSVKKNPPTKSKSVANNTSSNAKSQSATNPKSDTSKKSKSKTAAQAKKPARKK